jgi:hypothetical protein
MIPARAEAEKNIRNVVAERKKAVKHQTLYPCLTLSEWLNGQ